MQRRILALLLCGVLLLGVLAGCGKKNDTGDTSGDKTVNGTETKNDADSQLTAKYVYQAQYLELPVKTSYIDDSAVSGDTLFFYAQVQDESYAAANSDTPAEGPVYYPTVGKLLTYGLDTQTVGETDYSGSEGENSSTNVMALCAAQDGGVWLLEQTYTYAAPETSADNETAAEATEGSADDYGDTPSESQASYRLLRFDADGKQTFEAPLDLSAFIEAGGDSQPYLGTLYADSKGYLYTSDYQTLMVLDSEGKTVCAFSDENGGSLVQYSADKIGAITYSTASDGTSKNVFKVLDPATKAWGEELPLPNNAWNIYPGSGDYDLYYDYNGNLYGWKAETDESEKVVDWLACDVDSNNLNTYTVLPDGRVFAVGADYNRSTYEQTCELILLTPVDASTVTEKTELTLACMNLDWNLRGQIVKFNRASDKYRIVVKDYSEYSSMTYESAGSNGTMVTQSDDGLTKLNTEIMSGNVPDMILTDGLPVRQYAAKGLLEDLYPYIDADMGRDALITPVLDADSEDGKLYELPLSFSIVTATGLESVVGGYTSWTLADLEDALSKLNPDATIFNVDATRANVLSYCLYMNADTFVDWETGTASFDSQEFIDYLNFAAQFPTEFDYNTFDWNDYEQDAVRMRNGDQLLSMYGTIYGFDGISQTFAELGGDLCYIGFPSTSGHDGSSFSVSAPIAITTKCRDKDGAWSFIASALTDEYQGDQYYFPITKSAFDALAEKAMEKNYEYDENGDILLDENGEPVEASKGGFSYGDGPMIEVYAMTQEQYDTVNGLIENTNRIMRYDQSLMEIINDEAGAFFAGEKTAEETAQLIQNRVQLYMAEQG